LAEQSQFEPYILQKAQAAAVLLSAEKIESLWLEYGLEARQESDS
jgi:hypothetical protein